MENRIKFTMKSLRSDKIQESFKYYDNLQVLRKLHYFKDYA